MLDVSAGVVVFVGDGAILLRKQIEASGKIGKALFVEDINANAKGYEFLYRMETDMVSFFSFRSDSQSFRFRTICRMDCIRRLASLMS